MHDLSCPTKNSNQRDDGGKQWRKKCRAPKKRATKNAYECRSGEFMFLKFNFYRMEFVATASVLIISYPPKITDRVFLQASSRHISPAGGPPNAVWGTAEVFKTVYIILY